MKAIKIILLIVVISLNAGCWDKVELEDQGYVVIIGIDKSKVENMIDVTFQIANPQVGSTSKVQTKEPPSQIITISAPDFTSAKDIATSSVTRNITFTHTSTIIVSEELAKSEKFKNIILNSFRDRELRREAIIIVSKERASDFIRDNTPMLETRPHKYYEFMQKRWQTSGLVPYSSFNRLTERISGSDALFLAVYATGKQEDSSIADKHEDEYIAGQINIRGGNSTQMIGSAVFKDGKMIGKLTGEETRLTLLLRPKSLAYTWAVTYPDPLDENKRITLKVIKRASPDIKVNTEGENADIKIKVPISVHILAIYSDINYVTDYEKQLVLKKSLEKNIEEELEKIIQKAQEDLEGDIFTWYLAARKNFWTIEEYQNYNWAEKFPKANVDVSVDIEIEGFGKQLEPLKE